MTREEALLAFTDCKRAYLLAFNTPAGEAVLKDLTKYCRGKETCVAVPHRTGPIDIYRTFLLEGRRDVLLCIHDYLELSPEELVAKYTQQIDVAASE